MSKSFVVAAALLTSGMAAALTHRVASFPTVIIDDPLLRPDAPSRPLSPAEQGGVGLRPNRKSRRRSASLSR
jgi:hypothetical protein